MVISTPEDAAKMFRAEGKYPVRSTADKHLDWIMKSISPDADIIAFS